MYQGITRESTFWKAKFVSLGIVLYLHMCCIPVDRLKRKCGFQCVSMLSTLLWVHHFRLHVESDELV